MEGPNDILIEKSLHFAFKTSNNQAEYKAILVVLSLTREVGVKMLTSKTDSKLTVGNLNDEFQIKDPTLLQYYHWFATSSSLLLIVYASNSSLEVRMSGLTSYPN